MTAFPKDSWIVDSIKKRYIIVAMDGTIKRCTKADANGKLLSATYAEVTFQTHKKSGRVYFNMTWRGYTKSVLVNRVVALRYLPNPLGLPQVNHIDGDKQHNYLLQPTPELQFTWGPFQLEWSSSSDNEKHAHATGLKTGRGSSNSNAKLDAVSVLDIRASKDPVEVLMARYDVSRSTISNVLHRRTWKHV